MLYELTLAASESNWRLFSIRSEDPRFASMREQIFQRDANTCQFCGFQAYENMAVLNVDGNYYNNKISNLATACSLCSQCHFMESIGTAGFGGGTLIYLPDITQNQLNALCHTIFAGMALHLSYEGQLQSLLRSFKLLAQPVEKELGNGMSNPSTYGRLLIESNVPNAAALNKEVAEKLRLLPNTPNFSQSIAEHAFTALQNLQSGLEVQQ